MSKVHRNAIRGDLVLSNNSLQRLRERRRILLTAFDSAAWAMALTFAVLARMDFDARMVRWGPLAASWFLVVTVYIALAWRQRLHHGRAELASLEEIFTLGSVIGGSGVVLFAVNAALTDPWVPRSVPLMSIFVVLVITGGCRAVWRVSDEVDRRFRPMDNSVPVLILGAGDGGRQLIRSMRRAAERGWNKRATDVSWEPVGLLDNDLSKRHLRIYGVPVLGTVADLQTVARAVGASVLVVAIPSIGAAALRTVTEAALASGLTVKVLPGVSELLDGRVDITSVRDINMEDILGRHQVETDVESIASCVTGRRVLVTGAGGSIGSELCRQLHKYHPSELIMLDRDESALHAVQLSIHGRAMLDSSDIVLGDIRDGQFVETLFRARKPQVVFHAAALKHLPLLEQYPSEAVKTNIWGTLTVLEAARDNDVETFVNISTDKAADPCSVLGYSKRIAEGLTASIAVQSSGTYLSVRFGNVLGSRGSVLVSFAAQVAAGGPVTVTDPDVTRFFMTVREAVELVIQAAAIGRDGEALVLDMGKAVRIDDVARQLINMSGRPCDIEYTGLRAGEKLHELLLGAGEPDERPIHPLVSHVQVPGSNGLNVLLLDPSDSPTTLVASMADMCLTMGEEVAQLSPHGTV